ncbi:hypothetical protein WG66_008048 [Moniliophthora roreri]|nr:hypothetical protein WG66_008048 [Moniliophthora roreri]
MADGHAQEIKQILREPEEKLRALEEEITQLQAQRGDLQSFIDNHRSLLSPIRRVHSDILREIFVQCLPEDHLPVRSLREAPLLLTGICRSWHEIVVNTPRLWNRIHVSLPFPLIPPITESFRSLMRLRTGGIKLWLDRAGGLPLSLSFHATMPPQMTVSTREGWNEQSLNDLQTLYLDFTRCLLTYSARWGSVSLIVPHCVREFLETYKFGSLDLLKSFRSALPGRPFRSQENTQVHPWHGIFKRAHSLRVLHLNEPHSDIPIPWGNLTELSLSVPPEFITASEAARLLSLCTSLHWCTLQIRLGFTSHVAPPTSSPVVLPYLHSANFSFLAFPHASPWQVNAPSTTSQMESVNLVFDAITAPVLKHLSLKVFPAAPAPPPTDTSPFVSFVERSGCALSSLVVNLPTMEDSLTSLLNSTPSLSAFTMYVESRNRSLVDPTATGFIDLVGALTSDATHTDVLCPLLEEITLVHCVSEDAEPLLELAEARCRPSDDPDDVRLKKMFVSFGTFLNGAEYISRRLQMFRDRGMVVRWSSPLDKRGQLQDDSPLCGFSRPPGIATHDRIVVSEGITWNFGRKPSEHLY